MAVDSAGEMSVGEGESVLIAAANHVRAAEVLLVTAGAGMGVDSGLPDFRGREGFWRAYPPFARLGLEFEAIANPRWFRTEPRLAWGFYGHRLLLYRRTRPHDGFMVLRRWAERRPERTFVFTSNVDAQFQRAGFVEEQMLECHGSIEWWQCAANCGVPVWRAPDEVGFVVDAETCRASGPLPSCPGCGGVARPNILMFGDWDWDAVRTSAQEERFLAWRERCRGAKTVIVELGAGLAVPTVRRQSEILQREGATLVRINPREAHGPRGTLSVPLGAREALMRLDALVGS